MPKRIRAGTTSGSYASCMAFTPDGTRLATGHPDGTILMWQVALPRLFFFKQKTAYEMTCDWSSDVCSSDLTVVDELGEDVPGGPVHGQPRPGGAAGDLLPHAHVPPLPRRRADGGLPAPPALGGDSHVLLPSLPDLAAHLLAGVTHALALVRVGLAELADVRGDLADRLLVDPLHDEPGGGLHPQGDPVRRVDRHRVAVAERALHPAALGLHPVPDADDLQR